MRLFIERILCFPKFLFMLLKVLRYVKMKERDEQTQTHLLIQY